MSTARLEARPRLWTASVLAFLQRTLSADG